jgi:hypothetical protein
MFMMAVESAGFFFAIIGLWGQAYGLRAGTLANKHMSSRPLSFVPALSVDSIYLNNLIAFLKVP